MRSKDTKNRSQLALQELQIYIRRESTIGVIAWRCTNRKCSGFVYTENEHVIKENPHHTCVIFQVKNI